MRVSATKTARMVKPHEQLLALSRKMQVNTEAPANEAKAEVRVSRWPRIPFETKNKPSFFFLNVGFFTGMSLYSIAGLSIHLRIFTGLP